MSRDDFAARIDHTVLGPATTPDAVRATVAEADRHGMNACVPPCYLEDAAERAPDVTLVTVVGFPHGQHRQGAKRAAAVGAWQAGADELDVVANVGRLLAGDDDAVVEELAAIVAAVPVPVKVIVEAGLLDAAATRRAGEATRAADAAYVKTSTGFDGGATVEDVEALSEYRPVKASGGIRDYARARELLDAGAERIGTSRGVAVVEGAPD